jgi:transcriptional regulator with PAS, ATPase and Fis domain
VRRGDVQIVSTTSRPMLQLIENGEFRAELYYRLNVVRIDLGEPGTDLNA